MIGDQTVQPIKDAANEKNGSFRGIELVHPVHQKELVLLIRSFDRHNTTTQRTKDFAAAPLFIGLFDRFRRKSHFCGLFNRFLGSRTPVTGFNR